MRLSATDVHAVQAPGCLATHPRDPRIAPDEPGAPTGVVRPCPADRPRPAA